MKNEYISRQEALDALGVTKNATKYGGDHSGYDTRMLYEIHDVLTGLPSADVVPVVHGKWINGRCNKCGEHAPFWAMASTYYTSNFCPNCGARMDGGDEHG